MRPILTAADVAERLGTTEQHIRKLAREHKIPHYRIGGLVKFDADEIGEFLERSRVVVS